MLKLNSIPKSVFDAVGAANDKATFRTNSGNGAEENVSINRKELVAAGRLLFCEYTGRNFNEQKEHFSVSEKYQSKLNGIDYGSLARGFVEKKFLYCAAKTDAMEGRDEPLNFEKAVNNSIRYANSPIFMKLMSAIDEDILKPLLPAVLSDVGMGLVQLDTVAFGRTKEITVNSNDIFLFEDSSWGSSHSVSKNYLYAKTITMTPKPYASNATIKWYQSIVNGDPGEYYLSIVKGMYNKMYAIAIKALKAATVGSKYIPAGLTAQTYSSKNWNKICSLVAAANGVKRADLMAVGTISALSNVLPVDGTGALMAGLQYQLGREWFEKGFLPNASGVDLFEITPSIVPGTQNSTLDTIDTGDNIYILAKGLYKPVYCVLDEGSPIVLTATPSGGGNGALGTADFTVDINATAVMDIKPVFAQKVGVIKGVYA